MFFIVWYILDIFYGLIYIDINILICDDEDGEEDNDDDDDDEIVIYI